MAHILVFCDSGKTLSFGRQRALDVVNYLSKESNKFTSQTLCQGLFMVHLLIPYVPLANHHDPILEEFTYGDVESRARKLKRDLKRGDYAFFHTTVRGRRYITAYYVVDRVLDTSQAASSRAVVDKYKNPHIDEYVKGERRNQEDAILFGDPIESRKLSRPLPFNKALTSKLSLGITFKKGLSENQCIGSATRQWRTLTDKDVETLLSEIRNYEREGLMADVILSTDEVLEIREVDLENFIMNNTHLLGSDLVFKSRQRDTRAGRLDLLFEDSSKNLVVVELKLNEIGRGAINQLRGYIHQVKEDTGKEVRGIIVCKKILPTFIEEFRKLRKIKIFQYGWKLQVYPRKWDD
jgi:hypothetical protein